MSGSHEMERLVPLSSDNELNMENLTLMVQERHGEGKDMLKKWGGPKKLTRLLKSDVTAGISDDEAPGYTDRIAAYGENKFKEVPPRSFFSFLWEALQDKILILLSVAAVISIVLEMTVGHDRRTGWIEGAAILSAVALVSLVTAGNDYSKDRKFRELAKVSKDRKCTVIRGGENRVISVYDLLVGDVVALDTGDYIPADGVFLSGHAIRSDESSMTGEPIAVRKGGDDMFFLSGCTVAEGTGNMVVVAVGMASQWGVLKASLTKDGEESTPLQERLDWLADLIGKLGFAASIVTFSALVLRWAVVSYAVNSDKWDWADLDIIVQFIIISITIIVVAVPEGLPLAVTISLAYSMMKMMKDQNLVRHLVACETMGSATQICSDKTGTLTQNRMTVVKSWMAGIYFDERNKATAGKMDKQIVHYLTEGIAINSNAYITEQAAGLPQYNGNKTECALLVYAQSLGCNYATVRKEVKVHDVIPFSSARKRMSTVIKTDDGYRLYCKGASEVVLGLCDNVISASNGGVEEIKLTDAHKRRLTKTIEKYASNGLRTLSLAYTNIPVDSDIGKALASGDGASDIENITDGMVLIGIVGIEDPIRPEVPHAVEMCQRAGVQVRMLTGDNILTAKNIAKRCGILTEDGIAIEGPKFRKLSDKEVDRMLPNLQVMARSSPDDKLRVVAALRRKGEVVAVTGDGTNDAPQLFEADVGFSMGIAGTEVAKDASDIILLDDNFNSIVKAVMWGRNVYDSIRKFVQFQLTVNVAAVIVAFVGAVTEGDSPLKAVQLLWVNLIMDTMAALALATEPPTEKLLNRKPYGRKGQLITYRMWRFIFGHAAYQLIALFIILYLGHVWFPWLYTGVDLESEYKTELMVTIIFNSFVFCQIFNEFNARRLDDTLDVFGGLWNNYIFIGVIVITVIVQAIIVQFGGKASQTVGLNWKQWLFCVAVGAVEIPWGFFLKLLRVPDEPTHESEKAEPDEKTSLLGANGTRTAESESSDEPELDDFDASDAMKARRERSRENWGRARKVLSRIQLVRSLRNPTRRAEQIEIS